MGGAVISIGQQLADMPMCRERPGDMASTSVSTESSVVATDF